MKCVFKQQHWQMCDLKNDRPPMHVILAMPFNFILRTSHLSVYITEIPSFYYGNAT